MPEHRPAGFWPRAAAWTLDAALLAPLALLASWRWTAPAAATAVQRVEALLGHGGRVLGSALATGTPLPRLGEALRGPDIIVATASTQAAIWSLAWPALLAFVLLGALYHATAECSHRHASIGKRLLGLRVCDRHGRRLDGGRALLRHGAGALSWLTLNLGHAWAAVGPAHLALHDRCSGTRVVATRGTNALPRWTLAWLALLAAAMLAASVWATLGAAAVMRAALEQALW